MLNRGDIIPIDQLQVLDRADGSVALQGQVNVTDEEILANVRASIRRGHPQIRQQPANGERVLVVGGGPSLEATLPALRQAMFEGAKVVTVNGSYQWCVDRNIRPSMQVVMDARPHNARFLSPAVPNCRYLLASQCHPSAFDAVEGRPDVWIFHACAGGDDGLMALLDAYYAEQWFGIGGGTTVVMRAVWMLRQLGFLRIELFGVDSCYMDGKGHAYDQPENDGDRKMTFMAGPADRPDLARSFVCAPWMLKQCEDMLQMLRINGDSFKLTVHGDGLLAYTLSSMAAAEADAAQVGGEG